MKGEMLKELYDMGCKMCDMAKNMGYGEADTTDTEEEQAEPDDNQEEESTEKEPVNPMIPKAKGFKK